MTEQLPNGEGQWDDLPLPNREEAWQKMQHLLDKEEKRRRPFWFWRIALLALLLIGVAVGNYFLLTREALHKTGSVTEKRKTQNFEQRFPIERKNNSTKKNVEVPLLPNAGESENMEVDESGALEVTTLPRSQTSGTQAGKENGIPGTGSLSKEKNTVLKKTVDAKQQVKRSRSEARTAYSRKTIFANEQLPAEKTAEPAEIGSRIQPSPLIGFPLMKNNLPDDSAAKTKQLPDSLKAVDPATLFTLPPVVHNKKQKQKSRVEFSAGVGLQQTLAVGGQQASAYNLHGRQSRWSDHIPSVYVKAKSGRWFLQGELQYRVPQAVAPLSFSETTTYDAATKTLQNKRQNIEKLYYHQLPVSVNYLLLPNWSLGAGATYNLFAGAVTEQELTSRDVNTGAQTLLTQVIPVKGYTDSFLYRSAVGVLLQTDYHWKRLSVGVRYTQGLQSFIKYTTPDGAILSQKNSALQAVLRFRLF